ncbi:hypothetical protein N826_39430 [Skermanella aerolata KACC 11604]|nr:hypothetical protein N826_39430 [Skermanella aerolata KACC 11604]
MLNVELRVVAGAGEAAVWILYEIVYRLDSA